MHTPLSTTSPTLPRALSTACYAVTLLEDNPLFNSGYGAVFTRDGLNELEASVMVSRGFAKRAVAVTGLRRVRNPILLAQSMLEHGDRDILGPRSGPDVPSAQGHTLLHGVTAEVLAVRYGLDMVEPGYFFTRKRWDEHVRGLERENAGRGAAGWAVDEYVPQGTCGAVALDADGVVCCATSTGGLTNKLTGRIGDTPCVGTGFWAEEWMERGDPTGVLRRREGPAVLLSEGLRGLMADCLQSPFLYMPITRGREGLVTMRSIALSGTGNGDSFLRTAACRTVGAMARFGGQSGDVALNRVAGPGGELQRSAGDRWGQVGEGEGGMIGIECVVVRDEEGEVIETRSHIFQDLNCGGMFRAWVDEDGAAWVRIWRGCDDDLRVHQHQRKYVEFSAGRQDPNSG